MLYRLLAAVLLSLVLAVATARPTRADASRGSQLARQWCASCHVTSGNPPAMFSRDLRAFTQSQPPEPPISCAPSYCIRTARCRICR